LHPQAFDDLQDYVQEALAARGVEAELLITGGAPIAPNELSRIRSQSRLYYRFLLCYHPQVRQMAGIIERLRDARQAISSIHRGWQERLLTLVTKGQGTYLLGIYLSIALAAAFWSKHDNREL
jgi:hypothetical protein